jgi:hypothetical protein
MARPFWEQANNWYNLFPTETWVVFLRKPNPTLKSLKLLVLIGKEEEVKSEAIKFAEDHGYKLIGVLSYPEAQRVRDKLKYRNKYEDFLGDGYWKKKN